MKARMLLSCLVLSALVGVPGYAKKPKPTVAVTITVKCKGDRNSCITYAMNDKLFTMPGDAEYIVVDGTQRSACPSTGITPTKIFLHDAGSAMTGRGFLGVETCLDPATGNGEVLVPSSTPVYPTLSEWMNATGVIH